MRDVICEGDADAALVLPLPVSFPPVVLDHVRQLDDVLAFLVLLTRLEGVLLPTQKTNIIISCHARKTPPPPSIETSASLTPQRRVEVTD